MKPRCRIKKSDFTVGSPLDTHLGDHIDEIYFGMENILSARPELDQILQDRKVHCLKSISSRTENIIDTPVTEKERFLSLMNDQL